MLISAMDFDSFSKNICQELEKDGKVRDVSSHFSKCGDDVQRCSFVLDLDIVKSQLSDRLNHLKMKASEPGKSDQESERHRIEGNKLFTRKQNELALNSYNKSALVASSNEPLALAYANRSAVLHDLGDWLHCLRDIDLALKAGYPAHLQHKLYERRGNCWLRLGEISPALESFKLAKDSAPADKLTTISTKLESLLNDKDLIIKSDIIPIDELIQTNRPKLPDLNGPKNGILPSASTSIRMVYTAERGRCLVATQVLEPGTTVIVEKAFASILLREFRESHCHYCLQRTPGPVPCHQCSQVGYCSTQCREKAWSSYHQTECGWVDILDQADMGKNALLAFRTLLMVKDRPDFLRHTLPDVYDSSDYATIHNLIGSTSQRSVADLFRRTLMAVYLAGIMGEENRIPVVAELLRLLQSYPCNAHEISVLNLKNCSIGCAVQVAIGSAAMPVLSLINHSCDPNVFRHVSGEFIAVTTIRRIHPDEELLDNYGYHFSLHPLEERRSQLKAQYYFDCSCPACIQQWPQHYDAPHLCGSYVQSIKDPLEEDIKKLMDLKVVVKDELLETAGQFARYMKF